jgi:hypothetical protein
LLNKYPLLRNPETWNHCLNCPATRRKEHLKGGRIGGACGN